MRLLVSVRDEREARAALAGGAEIIDAKEPAAGSLGPVASETLAGIRRAVPPDLALSAALGDVGDPGDVARALGTVAVALDFAKLGFLGVTDRPLLREMLTAAAERVQTLPGAPILIAVGYADWERTGSLPPVELGEVAADAGAGGLLVDTAIKDGRTLFAHCHERSLEELARELARRRLLFAVGGSLGAGDLARARAIGADVFGVRTAACDGGRNGAVSEVRVRGLAVAALETCERS